MRYADLLDGAAQQVRLCGDLGAAGEAGAARKELFDLVVLQHCLNDNHRLLHQVGPDGGRLYTPEARRAMVAGGGGRGGGPGAAAGGDTDTRLRLDAAGMPAAIDAPLLNSSCRSPGGIIGVLKPDSSSRSQLGQWKVTGASVIARRPHIRPSRVNGEAGPTVLKTPGVSCSASVTIHGQRSRASTHWAIRPGPPGASTSPPR